MPNRFLIWGETGWVAGHLKALLEKQGKDVHTTSVRMENVSQVAEELRRIQPTHVLNAAGCTGRPNVDWCEDNKAQTVRSNVIGTLTLADQCYQLGIHCTVFATGCIYQYDEHHPIGGAGFTEEDAPNFTGSFYSMTKGHVEPILSCYDNVLILRLRMPVSDDLHPRNFVTKILNYDHVVNVPNSNTILHDLLPISIALAEHRDTGVFNFTNPGAISHNQVLTLFRDIIRPSLTWRNFSLEEQSHVIKAGRSNCMLDTSKLEAKAKDVSLPTAELWICGFFFFFHSFLFNWSNPNSDKRNSSQQEKCYPMPPQEIIPHHLPTSTFKTQVIIIKGYPIAMKKFVQLSFAAFHFTVTWLALWVVSRDHFAFFTPKHVSLTQMLPLSVAMTLNIVFPNLSLAYSTITFYQIARVLVTPCVAIIDYVFYSVSMSGIAASTLVVACLGVTMVSYYDSRPSNDANVKTTSQIGIVFALMGVVFSSLYTVWIAAFRKKLNISSMQLLLNQAPLSAFLLLYLIPWVDNFPVINDISISHWILIPFSGILAMLINISQFFIIAETGPVASTVVGHSKTCTIVVLSWAVSGRAATDMSVIGLLIALSGIFR
ncbi:hypothetical protein BKA59DRAFT_532229 [Fusarium tricinctum]|uniref:RmlD-like substrate binding domain-containing protein n=1 Tax=Fusarium tricinctum TaxID=61284 RepID=A0A8K0RT76_9HYPO|nr:hypothetical protein BKA59DRAFT_532229 [Fusarium tricinctum]